MLKFHQIKMYLGREKSTHSISNKKNMTATEPNYCTTCLGGADALVFNLAGYGQTCRENHRMH